MVKKIILVFIIFQSLLVFCQNQTFYLEGTLAKSKIYMEISSAESPDPNAIYFYQKSLKNIPLEGIKKGSDFIFTFESNDTIHEKFTLKRVANNNFEGTWSNQKGKSFPVQLHPIDFSNYKSDLSEDYRSEKLNFVKCQLLQFEKQKTTLYKGKEFVWYSEKHCDAEFFRLGNGFAEKSKTLINSKLEKIHIENVLEQLNCTSHFEYSTGKGIGYETEITFLSNNTLGYKTASYWDCGGPYPSHGTDGYLIDLNTSKNYEIDEIIAFDESVITQTENNFKIYRTYRETYFAPKLFDLIDSEQHFKKSEETDEDSCDMTNLEHWHFVSWIYTEKGIEFKPSFAHVEQSCEETYLVTFEKLKKYKHPQFPYSF